MGIPLDVLMGKSNAKVTKYGFEKLNTFGIGRERSADWWKALFWMLVEQGYILEEVKDNPAMPRMKIKTYAVAKPKSSQWVLRHWAANQWTAPASLPKLMLLPSGILLEQDSKPAAQSSSSSPRHAASGFSLDPSTEALFQKLREYRTEQAKKRGVSSFIIFHDSVLKHIARFA
jgi:ATP-dependent DNA helicase RecQ